MLTLKDHTLLSQQCYIAGPWCDKDGGATISYTNPDTGETLGILPTMRDSHTRRAIEYANDPFPE